LTTWRHEPLPPSPLWSRPPATGNSRLIAFDLLNFDGEDFRPRPLEERRDRLAQLVAGADGVRFSAALTAEGATVFAHACRLGLEGIVSKRVGSRYRSGTSRNWLKCLNPEFQRR
jgi:bifunctional non-homologous end joining protein LigD